ncbi:MAG: adenylosuccinate lyase [Flavobacteriales bacterium]|nr:adenylosuccinate lyase [Flavobacteriales bacterium]MCB9197009.1 adenylosuccinate lyase [Flavobacteriales bacterium]
MSQSDFSLRAVSPIDGRYQSKCAELSDFFSEEALMKYRVLVEIEYFIALCELPLPQLSDFDQSKFESLRDIYRNFSSKDALMIKEIESTTNHDVKAVEYFIKERMETLKIGSSKEFVHFGLTSQDINNTAIPRSLKDAVEATYLPKIDRIIAQLNQFAEDWKNVSMLAKTHGQPASPTKLGKEFKVFAERLQIQLDQFKAVPYSSKFGGATGNFNAHHVAYPTINWVQFANKFLKEKLLIERSQTTTQIEHYDNLAALFDAMKRINTILIDLNRDMWTYISMEYFKQKIKSGEVGSSAMPHKVNPIDFENSEGNLGMANAILEHLSAKLPVSRLQRDLTDSTVLRNIGVPFGHIMIAFASLDKGLGKILLNESAFKADLENNWAVVAEAIQTVLRREGYPQPYEALKALTRTNEGITANSISNFIDGLNIPQEIKSELKLITPHNYTGVNLVG